MLRYMIGICQVHVFKHIPLCKLLFIKHLVQIEVYVGTKALHNYYFIFLNRTISSLLFVFSQTISLRDKGEHGSDHHEDVSPEFHCLLSHPLIPLPQAVHAVGVLCVVNDLVARVGI